MFGSEKPIEMAYHEAVSNRLMSLVYFALNEGVAPNERRHFRKVWSERGTYFLGEHLLRCASADWSSYPDAFFINEWVAKLILEFDAASFTNILDRWLADEPLPLTVDEDPLVEDEKVKKLAKLFAALNP